ncbi:hypothetical protein ACHAQJ_003612 [Trichoderma viride]
MTDRKEDGVVIESRRERNKRFQAPQNESEPNEKILIADAAVGFAVEKGLGPWESVKVYPQAILWALVMAVCVIMEGYDTALLGSFFAYLYLAPESPWYLVRVGRIEEAERSLRRLQSSKANINPKNTLATIIHTNKFEQENNIGTSYWDCVRGEELRRTEIACMAFTGAVLCGINFAYNSSYFFQGIGVSTSTTKIAVLMPYFGRRQIYLWGMVVMCAILLSIGILNVWTNRHSIALAQAVLTLVWTFVFQFSVGQLSWAFPAEVGSTRLRQKTICIARDVHGIVNIVSGILQQYFMNPEACNVKGCVGFVWGGTCFSMIVWSYFRLPETWNRPYEELDILFAQKVPARKFATTEVHPIEDTDTVLAAKQEA